MKSRADRRFWKMYEALPSDVRETAITKFRLWTTDPFHPSLRFKRVGIYWSARVTKDYRAIGRRDGDTITWFFIGTHAGYDKLL